MEERHRRQLEAPVDPGPCPTGWSTGPPDYVGIGVQKAGTTWWNLLIADHPHVDPAVRKELHFFQHGWDASFGDSEIEAYHRYFARAEGHRSGEWTPRYLMDPWTPSRLQQAAPDARLLVLLRDPVARFRSGITHAAYRHGQLHPRFLIEGIERGRYATQIERLRRWFPADQVLVLQLERCIADASAELARTYRFLALDDTHRPTLLEQRVYGAKAPLIALPDDLTERLAEEYRPELARLSSLVPELDLSLWPTAAR